MPKIVPIVEGDGDAKAVPVLIRRVLHDRLRLYDWEVTHPKKAHSLPTLRKKLANYLRYAAMEDEAQGVLILLDLDDGCPKEEAQRLAAEIRSQAARLPVAIVLAHREYEAWFLASIETIAPQYGEDLTPPADVESVRDAKGWLSRRLFPGGRYKETAHQPSMTTEIDFDLAARRSRSFSRFLHAVELLTQHAGQGGFVSP